MPGPIRSTTSNSPRPAARSTPILRQAFGWRFTSYGPSYDAIDDAGIDAGIDGGESRTAARSR